MNNIKFDRNIYLIGYRCTGKTSIGKKLAQKMAFQFLDTDEMVQKTQGRTISKIVDESGWNRFRELEKKALFKTAHHHNLVVSTGGGIVLDPENLDFLNQNGQCIWLKAKIDTIIQRLESDINTPALRPALSRLSLKQETQQILNDRTPMYEKARHISLDTDEKSIDRCADEIYRRLLNVRF